MDEYIKQATDFLQKTYSKMKIEYVGLAVNKEWKEKEKRCLYEITLTSPRGSMSFDFWDSIRNTRIRTMPFDAYNVQANKELAAKKEAAVPSVYDVLACLQNVIPAHLKIFARIMVMTRIAVPLYGFILQCKTNIHSLQGFSRLNRWKN